MSQQMSIEERFLKLAVLNIGEALVEISNQSLRGRTVGRDMIVARDKLQRAMAALNGEVWVTPVDPQYGKPAGKPIEGE